MQSVECCAVVRGSDLELLWLWYRPRAIALMRPLAWEPPCAVGVDLKKKKNGVPMMMQWKQIPP